ncbi:Sperm-associated antigen 4 protein [Diatrype stigma]|uniref:Sperm-associated antigen 4 protein n=1 Tax=Diatrype stigma TaxID=117547 RepID=A0AAN9YRZ0_9PEZI
MKATILNLAVAASLAGAQPHHHARHHHQRDGSPVEQRDVATEVTYVPAYVTKYVLDDEDVTPDEAQAGIDKGLYVVVGQSTPTFTPPPPPTTTSSEDGGIFLQKIGGESTSSSPSSSPAPPTTTSSVAATSATSSAVASASPSGGFDSGAKGIDADFPDGKIPCTTFPSDYGAIPLDWLQLGGWSGIQKTPNYQWGASFIDFIETAVKGDTCMEGQFCSYACPEGYLQSQWPDAQGSTGQSIGGLYCNNDGFLELTRSGHTKLCEKGLGNVKIINKMNQNVAVCRTQYPGTESMVIPLDAQPGGTFDLANVDSTKYYEWGNKDTSLQYYVNQAGVSVEDGCLWDCLTHHDECGNWAPTIIGTGQAADGITYLSVFPNTPTSQAKLNFNIRIYGDVSTECTLNGGDYSVSSSGCTTGLQSGGTAYIEFSS